MQKVNQKVAEQLLDVNAVKLQPNDPFTWASGWKSPIYCDNRKALSYPATRTYIKQQLAAIIKEKYPEVEVIAGVATGAIAQGALVAEELGLPFVYIRPAAKSHGMNNMIEGDLKNGSKVVVIEDLISTGGSSLKAVEALRAADCKVISMLAIFTYGFPVAEQAFADAKVELITLSNYNALIDTALNLGTVSEAQVDELKEWRKAPSEWGK